MTIIKKSTFLHSGQVHLNVHLNVPVSLPTDAKKHGCVDLNMNLKRLLTAFKHTYFFFFFFLLIKSY